VHQPAIGPQAARSWPLAPQHHSQLLQDSSAPDPMSYAVRSASAPHMGHAVRTAWPSWISVMAQTLADEMDMHPCMEIGRQSSGSNHSDSGSAAALRRASGRLCARTVTVCGRGSDE